MHRPRLLVDRLIQPHIVQHGVKRFFIQANIGTQLHVFQVRHQIAEYRTFPASGGLGALGHFFIEVFQAASRGDRTRIHFPINLHRHDVFNRFKQTLVAQIANDQRFRRGT